MKCEVCGRWLYVGTLHSACVDSSRYYRAAMAPSQDELRRRSDAETSAGASATITGKERDTDA